VKMLAAKISWSYCTHYSLLSRGTQVTEVISTMR
jgi:hypothetical protein